MLQNLLFPQGVLWRLEGVHWPARGFGKGNAGGVGRLNPKDIALNRGGVGWGGLKGAGLPGGGGALVVGVGGDGLGGLWEGGAACKLQPLLARYLDRVH